MNRENNRTNGRGRSGREVTARLRRLIPAAVIAALLIGGSAGCGSRGGTADRAGMSGAAKQAAAGPESAGQSSAGPGSAGQLPAGPESAGQSPAGQSSEKPQEAAGQGGGAVSQKTADGGVYEALEVHFIDVGQGDATLLICGDSAMLIDAGESDKGTAIQNYLQKQGVERLDYLVLTHPDADHIGGAPVIITKFDPGQVLVSNFQKDNSTYRKLIQALDDKRLKAQTYAPGSSFELGTAVCTVLAPGREYDSPNDASVALLVENGQNAFLFTGDAGEKAEEDILAAFPDIRADVYKAGHHGSSTASGEALLDAVCPAWAVISCAEGNSYGHPHAGTLNNLRARGIQVYRTDEQGSLIASADGSEITWNAAPSDTWKAGEPAGAGISKAAGEKTVKQPDGDSPARQAGEDGPSVQPDTNGPELGEAAPASAGDTDEISYVLNTKTKKFHIPSCSYLPTANREDTSGSRESVVAAGYEPCKKCKP